ncbi:protein FAM177A1-like isoform X2 [Adelges cooleyi]|nr:protein FAM177A1-like isoform X2 [Adelges cooleyi]XP_050423909.1 protein FAM177A1-like isoform X2 [Adelges cooleyi]XP_050423910.1 protein FAM177A1-like isoform X2 [Adelges cooleyi]XP_050423911.1 protein FAM177A1-like isoform X2 [Adelges cooleyi]
MENISIQIEPHKTYFSDGCVESMPEAADEIDLLRGQPRHELNEPDKWSSRLLKRSTDIASSALNKIDYLGESLACFFGITTPKYQFEINYHNNIVQELNSERISDEENMKGWNPQPQEFVTDTEPC